MLPQPVLKQVQAELLDYKDTGCSVMELSHRSKEFEAVIAEAEADLRSILSIPDNYKVLFMQGGATAQFAGIVMNLGHDKPLDYIVSGTWSEKALQEAQRLGAAVNVVVNSKALKHTGRFPSIEEWKFSEDASYVYYCDNETVHGVEFQQSFVDAFPHKNVPVVCDMSSNILSRPFDVSKFGLVYGGVQKNVGPAGVTIVIIREDLINCPKQNIPLMLDYKVFADNKSLYNTPPTFTIYVCGLVLKWILGLGGIHAIEKMNNSKAGLLYEAIDSMKCFQCPVSRELRSRMNVTFRLINKTGEADAELEKRFVSEADKMGLVQLAGHRSVGGIRASLYNALSLEAAEALVAFMKSFASNNELM